MLSSSPVFGVFMMDY